MPKCVKPSSSKNLFHMSQLFVLIMNVDELALEHVLDPACFASTWSPLMPYDALSNALGTKANEKHEIIALESADSSGVPCASIANIWTLPDFPSEYELFPGFPALEPENSLEPNEPLNLPDLDNLGIMESVQECVTTQDGNLIHIDEWPSHNLPSRELEIVRKSGSSIKAKKRKKNPRNTPKTTRRSIQPGVIEFLEAQFDQNPYPSKADMESFSLSQGVLPKTVRNWFCNTRSRRDPTRECVSLSLKY
jgi:hypothetical protein